MRNTLSLRFGLGFVALVAAGLELMLFSCGGQTRFEPETAPETGSPDQNGNVVDSGPAVSPPTLVKFIVVNAATDLGPDAALNPRGDGAFRLCFKQAGAGEVEPVAPLPPEPTALSPVPGIFYGRGGPLPKFGLHLNRALIPIIMNAKTLFEKKIMKLDGGADSATCDKVLGPSADAALGLRANIDYWELPEMAPNSLVGDKVYLLALTGCPGNTTLRGPDRLRCGRDFTPTAEPSRGNLALRVFETARTPVSPTQLGVQFLHASAQADALLGTFDVEPGFVSIGDGGFDASTYKPVTTHGAEYGALTEPIGITGVKPTDYFTFHPRIAVDPHTTFAPHPLTEIQELSGLASATAPSPYVDGANYVFVMVGQLGLPPFSNANDGGTQPPKTYNSRTFHFLAFPANPTF